MAKKIAVKRQTPGMIMKPAAIEAELVMINPAIKGPDD